VWWRETNRARYRSRYHREKTLQTRAFGIWMRGCPCTPPSRRKPSAAPRSPRGYSNTERCPRDPREALPRPRRHIGHAPVGLRGREGRRGRIDTDVLRLGPTVAGSNPVARLFGNSPEAVRMRPGVPGGSKYSETPKGPPEALPRPTETHVCPDPDIAGSGRESSLRFRGL
jgi:hypothetical protein